MAGKGLRDAQQRVVAREVSRVERGRVCHDPGMPEGRAVMLRPRAPGVKGPRGPAAGSHLQRTSLT